MDISSGIADLQPSSLPPQDWQQILLHAERFRRAAEAMRHWSDTAKKCVDYFEGKQWSEADLRKMKEQGRPALVINKIKPLLKLVLGYHLNNQTDVRYMPGNDGTGTADIARVLTQVEKQISQMNELPYVDTEVFMDGLLTGRGFYDNRMDFETNMFGNVKTRAKDPFSTYLDPDADQYDLNSGSYVMDSRFISLDEVAHWYGVDAMTMVRPLMQGGVFGAFPSTLGAAGDEVSPWRGFGGESSDRNSWLAYSDQFYDWVDRYRKTVRMLDIQHYVRTWRWFFVDLDTGDQKPVPDEWGPDRVQKVMTWAQANNEPLVVQRKHTRRLRWTHMVGDIMVFDRWSPYETFTLTPFFPYFRRGKTKGMVEDLIDPQDEVNVRRAARINIIARTSNSGWMHHKGTLTPEQRENLEENGGKPGFNLEWDGISRGLPEPKQITPGQTPVSIEQLEKEAENDLKEISGINASALGQVDQATVSGRAIQARQQQTVVGLELDIDNFHRTKKLCGRKRLELVQNFYNEKRIIRVTGTNASDTVETVINEASAMGIVNDITIGTYSVAIDETTLSDSFLAAQFDELKDLVQLGMPIPDSFLIDASSLGRKEELRQQVAQQRAAQQAAGVPPGASPPGGPGGAPTPPKPGGPPGPPQVTQHPPAAGGPPPGGPMSGGNRPSA